MDLKRFLSIILAAICVLTLTACNGKQKEELQAVPGIYKEEKVPELILGSLGTDAPFDTISYQPANYSWNWPKGNGEYGGVEACGIGPTDPAIMELRDPILLTGAITVKLVWPNFQAHSATVVSWDTAVFDLPSDADASQYDSFLRDTELTETDDFERTLVLEPNRVYDIYAYWQEVNGSSFGNAHYYAVTKGDAENYSDYLGRQYTGADPWGNPLSITLISIDGNVLTFEYMAVIGEGEYTRTFVTESSGELSDGVMLFDVNATAKEYDAMHLDYSGSLALRDGSLFVTYGAGSVVEESTEGGSAGYQALALEGENKTVELKADDPGLPSENQDTSCDVELVSHEANVGDRRVTITAMGLERQDGIDGCGIRTLNIFEGSDLIQTINMSEAIDRDGVSGAIGYGYTEAWDMESSFYTQDINFDGYEDLVVMGWIPNNTIPYYCYLWNADLEQYEYAFMLQGISIDTDNKEIISEYRYSGDNYEYRYDHYRFNDNGELVLVDRVVSTQ